MQEVLPLARWNKEKLSQRENSSDQDSDKNYEEFVVPKKEASKAKA